jgi:protein CpxP
MFLYENLAKVCLGLVIALACTATALAQQTGTAQQDSAPDRMQREGRRGPRGEGGRDHRMMGMMRSTLRGLNLTDAQQQQARAILERFAEATRSQREALQQLRAQSEQGASAEEREGRAKQLRGEIREAMKAARTDIVNILTPEQRAKFEQAEQERKARHEERRARRLSQEENQQ